MKDLGLRITLFDWFIIVLVSLLFSCSLSSLIYLILNFPLIDGLKVGVILGLSLSLISFALISINNSFLLVRIKNKTLWWVISAIFAFSSGYIGFIIAYYVSSSFGIIIPDTIRYNTYSIAFLVGLMNYLMGLLMYMFVRMKIKREHMEKTLLLSRLNSLDTQLNSHFIFNVLNTIASLIEIDREKALFAVVKLSTFLRKMIDENPCITIREELDNTKNYLELENLRFNNSISLEIMGNDSVFNFLVPKFSIQLLVENAVKHGFDNRENLHIEVNIQDKDKNLVISVSNDGKKIESFQPGLGLRNLNERLKILFRGNLRLENQKQTKFTMTLEKKNETPNCRR